jgi:hypothetical protein
MSSELERRLEGMLGAAPEPDAGAGEEALGRALAALRPGAPVGRGFRVAVVVLAVVALLLALAAGSLAAAGALHVSLGAKKAPATRPLSLPRGADGIAALIDGRLSVVTKDGFRMQGLRASAGALSPHALYVAAGIGDSLVAMKPDGQQAWSHAAGGNVVAIAWAPDGLRIAYVVARKHDSGRALHVIWGNGTHDTTIDRSVRAVRPSWRADSLGLAYVAAGGKAIVYDLAHASRRVVATRATGDVRQVSFAPSGKLLALATRTQVGLLRPGFNEVDDRGQIVGIGWTGRWFAVAHGGSHPVVWLTANPQLGAIQPNGAIETLDAEGHGIALAVTTPGGTRVIAATSGDRPRTVLQLPGHVTVSDLQLG